MPRHRRSGSCPLKKQLPFVSPVRWQRGAPGCGRPPHSRRTQWVRRSNRSRSLRSPCPQGSARASRPLCAQESSVPGGTSPGGAPGGRWHSSPAGTHGSRAGRQGRRRQRSVAACQTAPVARDAALAAVCAQCTARGQLAKRSSARTRPPGKGRALQQSASGGRAIHRSHDRQVRGRRTSTGRRPPASPKALCHRLPHGEAG
mmetsp:Transcript_117928/g.328553  ORF Transcript_117928/g.328553 Transcript_117928/m.328553 type:complete len:202 (+) Transcript_117928:195-800(+)